MHQFTLNNALRVVAIVALLCHGFGHGNALTAYGGSLLVVYLASSRLLPVRVLVYSSIVAFVVALSGCIGIDGWGWRIASPEEDIKFLTPLIVIFAAIYLAGAIPLDFIGRLVGGDVELALLGLGTHVRGGVVPAVWGGIACMFLLAAYFKSRPSRTKTRPTVDLVERKQEMEVAKGTSLI